MFGHRQVIRNKSRDKAGLKTTSIVHARAYTVDKTDWEKLGKIQGISTRPDKEIYRQEKKLEPSNLFSWTKTAFIYTWLLVRAREESDLSINNYGEVLPIISDISIVHVVPVIAKNGNACARAQP